jgi:NAD(P)H-dependent FMN reductase
MVRTPDYQRAFAQLLTETATHDAPNFVRELILLPALCFQPMRKSSSRRAPSVDVFSDNTTHTAVLPPTMPPQHHGGAHPACTQGHRRGGRVVRDNIDTLDLCPDDRVMQNANRHRTYQCEEESADRDDGSSARRTRQTSTTVLVIAGVSTIAVSRGLTHAAAHSSPNGITLNVFDNLSGLPHYGETAENQPLPRPVVALRDAAIEAQAAMVVTHYYGRIPATVHNAIDWLTRRWNHSALHDKPLAVIGPTAEGYSGVWSRHLTEESRPVLGNRIIEPVTVTTLHEAVTRLVEQADMDTLTRANARPHSRSDRACARTHLR